jgi:hypothetical protein
MNCADFQRVLPEILEHGRNIEEETHLRSCSACSSLVSDLHTVIEQARLLQATEEPSPRVWNSLEIALRREGLIREPQRDSAFVAAGSRTWGLAWLAPIAAVLVLGGVLGYERGPGSSKGRASSSPPTMQVATLSDDEQLLDALGSRSPAIRAEYAANLANVNSYIRDAEESAKADPNDEEAQQLLMDAYGQRAMVYQLALDRSLR